MPIANANAYAIAIPRAMPMSGRTYKNCLPPTVTASSTAIGGKTTGNGDGGVV